MNPSTSIILADVIVKAIGIAIVLIASIILFIALVSRVLPYLLLRPGFRAENVSDRGLKKYVFEGGRAIVYRPSEQNSKYVKQYILSSHGGEKYLKCMVDEGVHSIEFDVAVFDSADKMTDVITVRDKIRCEGVSEGVLLPYDAAYVQVIVRTVNSKRVPISDKAVFPTLKVAAFALAVSFCTALESLLIGKIAVAIAALISPDSSAAADVSSPVGLFMSIAIGLVLACIIFLFHLTKETEMGAFDEISRLATKIKGAVRRKK